jgi:hypothetical protein
MAGGGRPDLEPAGHALGVQLVEVQPEQAHERALALQLGRGVVDAATVRLLTFCPFEALTCHRCHRV